MTRLGAMTHFLAIVKPRNTLRKPTFGQTSVVGSKRSRVAIGTSLIVGLLLTLAGPPPVTAASTPAKDPTSLLPRPYAMEYSQRVDLDRDGDLDIAIVGVDSPVTAPQDSTEEFGEGNRYLLIARKDTDGWRSVGRSSTAVICRSCGGAFWGALGAPIELSASGNTLVIRQSAGSREVVDWTHRYRIQAGGVRLIGLDRSVTDRGSGGVVNVSTNYLTGVKITTAEGEIESAPKAGTRRGKPRVIFVNTVTVD